MPVIVHVHKAVPGTFKRVDRSTVYGNPYSHKWPMGQIISKFQAKSAKDAVDKFVKYYYASEQQWLREKARKDLRGWNLGCWGCDPCHAVIILRDVNDLCPLCGGSNEEPGIFELPAFDDGVLCLECRNK